MSGGHWDYKNDSLAHEMYEWMTPNYGDRGFCQAARAARVDP